MTEPSITKKKGVVNIEEDSHGLGWMKEIIDNLKEGKLPDDKKVARKLLMRSAKYNVIENILYKRGYTVPLRKCISGREAEYVLQEIHKGVCGSHSWSRMLAHKAVRAGYLWPGMNKDSSEAVKQCDKCQRFHKVTTNPPEELSPVSSPCPLRSGKST